MKNSYLLLSTLFLINNLNAQNPINEKCATMPSMEYRIINDPLFNINNFQNRNAASGFDTSGFLIVPVVFHVVYLQSDSANQSISDTLIWSQIDVLTKDFQRQNLDAINTLSIFDSIAVNTGIQFKLATLDPLGFPTNGITRTSTTTSHLLTPLNNSVKSNATGGKDPWPTDQYLNIWVCDMSFLGNPIVLGYAQFPGDNPLTDGVVLQYNYVGETLDPGTAPNNLGRTATHEVGHWFGMRHIWGDGACGVEDGIDDTPDAAAQSATNCVLSANTCNDMGNTFWGSIDPVNMVQNYMDYSEDGCMNLYTRYQMHKMWFEAVTDRFNLFNSNGCGIPTLNGYAISKRISCAGNCDGSATITIVAGTPPYSYLWNDGLAQDSITAINLCKGMYTVRIIDADNDTIFMNVYINGPHFIVPTLNIVDAPCTTCATGTITINANGGTPPYMFSLNSGAAQFSNTFSNLLPGNYLISITDSCGNIFLDSVSVPNTVGLNEINTSSTISIYPNPAQNEITLLGGSNNENLIEVSIHNMLGQKVYSFISPTYLNSLKILVSSFKNGMYNVSVQTSNALFQSKIIIEK